VLILVYIESQTLAQRIGNNCALPIDDTPWIFEQSLQVVEPVHAMNIVYRDLKPGQYFRPSGRRVTWEADSEYWVAVNSNIDARF